MFVVVGGHNYSSFFLAHLFLYLYHVIGPTCPVPVLQCANSFIATLPGTEYIWLVNMVIAMHLGYWNQINM